MLSKKQKLSVDYSEYAKLGFNVSQAKSLAWAEYFEQRMVDVDVRYQGNVDYVVRIDTHCADCNVGGQFLPDTVRMFIGAHKGHKTKTRKLR